MWKPKQGLTWALRTEQNFQTTAGHPNTCSRKRNCMVLTTVAVCPADYLLDLGGAFLHSRVYAHYWICILNVCVCVCIQRSGVGYCAKHGITKKPPEKTGSGSAAISCCGSVPEINNKKWLNAERRINIRLCVPPLRGRPLPEAELTAEQKVFCVLVISYWLMQESPDISERSRRRETAGLIKLLRHLCSSDIISCWWLMPLRGVITNKVDVECFSLENLIDDMLIFFSRCSRRTSQDRDGWENWSWEECSRKHHHRKKSF